MSIDRQCQELPALAQIGPRLHRFKLWIYQHLLITGAGLSTKEKLVFGHIDNIFRDIK